LKSSTILSRTFGSAVVGFVMFLVFFWLRSRYYRFVTKSYCYLIYLAFLLLLNGGFSFLLEYWC
jgi:hypothetical protein